MTGSLKALLTTLILGGLGLGTALLFDSGGEAAGEPDPESWGTELPPLGPDFAGGTLEAEFEGEEDAGGPGSQGRRELSLEEPVPVPVERTLLLLEGRVVDEGGRPIPGAEVGAFVRRTFDPSRFGRRRGFRNWRAFFRSEPLGRPTRTGPDGRFRFQGAAFPSSTIELAVRARGHAPLVTSREWKKKDNRLELGDLVLEDGGEVFGLVLGEGGNPIAGAKVRYESSGRRGRGPFRGSLRRRLTELIGDSVTDETGRFRLTDLPPGSFRLTAEESKHLPASSAALDLPKGGKLDAGRILLRPGRVLSGRVLGPGGKPVPEAEVEAAGVAQADPTVEIQKSLGKAREAERRRLPDDLRRRRGRFGRGWVRKRVRTDGEGRFAFEGLPSGGLRVTVRHPAYLSEVKNPVDPAETPVLSFLLAPRLSISGKVLDLANGTPIPRFGIKARRIAGIGGWNDRGWRNRRPGSDGGSPHRGRNRNRGRSPARASPVARAPAPPKKPAPKTRNRKAGGTRKGNRGPKDPRKAAKLAEAARKRAEAEARKAQRKQRQEAERAARRNAAEARRSQEEARRKARLGGSGRAPGEIPSPEAHRDGGFTLGGLEPGTYVLDVGAEGYVSQAAGPFVLKKGEAPPRAVIRLERGRVLAGRVLNAGTGAPIRGARVEVYLPPLQGNNPPVTSPLGAVMRGPRLGMRLQSLTTDGGGRFESSPLKSGDYWLRIEAEDSAPLVDKNLYLPAGQDLRGLVYKLRPGARVFGTVRNLPEGRGAMVLFVNTEGERRSTPVDAGTGAYDQRGLPAGTWFVRLQEFGRGGGGWRRTVTEAIATESGARPDLVLKDGQEIRFDLDAARTSLGTVKGRLTWNQKVRRGLEIALVREKDVPPPGEAGRDPRARRILQRVIRSLRSRPDAEGNYMISDIPPGAYRLEVRRAGSDRPLHAERIRIFEGQTLHRRLDILTGDVNLSIRLSTGKNLGQGRILLASSVDTAGHPPKEWRKLPSFVMAPVRGGKLRLRRLPVGEYEYFLTGKGILPLRGRLFLSMGNSNPPVKLIAKALPKKKKTTKKNTKKKKKAAGPSTSKVSGKR